MARKLWCWAVAAAVALSLVGGTRAAVPFTASPCVKLSHSRPSSCARSCKSGSSTRVQIELKAQGLYRPGLPPASGADGAQMPKPRELEVQTRLIFHERIVPVGPDALVPRSDSRAAKPSRSSGGGFAQGRTACRSSGRGNQRRGSPDGRGASRRGGSPGGRETRSWLARRCLEPRGAALLVRARGGAGGGRSARSCRSPARGPVASGDRWKVRERAAKVMSGYDTITSSNLEAMLESLDQSKARIRLKGRVEGSAFGGSGAIGCEGFATFDREAGRLDHLDLNRVETRQAGPVEAGLDMKSTLIVSRHTAEPPEALSDAGLAGIPLGSSRESERLQIILPGGRSTVLADRNWHIFWEDSRTAILKRLDGGRVIAQCNLMAGPSAGKGSHQDPAQFRDDIRRGLKDRFVQFLGAGEVGGRPDGGFRFKVGVQGREGDLGVLWYYYLLASPAGEQLLATFTLALDNQQTFGESDLELIGSLRWLPASRGSR